jgi:hypothetical protein
VKDVIANTTLAAFSSEKEMEGLRDVKGAWENQHNAWVCFLDEQSKKKKKGLRKIMIQETISAQ